MLGHFGEALERNVIAGCHNHIVMGTNDDLEGNLSYCQIKSKRLGEGSGNNFFRVNRFGGCISNYC